MLKKIVRRGAFPAIRNGFLAAVAGISLVACGGEEADSANASTPDVEAGSAASMSGDDVILARVAGTVIRQSDLDVARTLIPAQFRSLPDDRLLPALLNQLIDRRVTVLAAEKAGLADDGKVQREIAQAREDILQSALLESGAKEAVTEADIKKVYDTQIAAFVPQPEIRARHILAADEDTIKQAIERIEGGEAFEVVAGEVSTDGSAQSGGDLGYFTQERMVPEFAEVAFALEEGQLSDPFQSRFGWHVVKVEDIRDSSPPTLEVARDGLQASLAEEYMRNQIISLREAADIELTDAAPKEPEVVAPETVASPQSVVPEPMDEAVEGESE